MKYLFFSIWYLILNNNFIYVFYSEKKNYKAYYYSFILELLKSNENLVILYLSSDLDDKIENSRVKNLYIGSGLVRYFAFAIVRAKYFFMTITDLNNNGIYRNKFVNNYVYIFHAINSTHKIYTAKAFDNYDIICVVGSFQISEIRKREELFSLKKKKLVNTGYFYFDYLNDKLNLNKQSSKEYILFAPSWNYSERNLFELYSIDIIKYLLSKKLKVIFRPHQEHFKRNLEIINKIEKISQNNNNLILDKEDNNFNSLNNSYCLITDYSGISHEFLFIFNKPVLYFEELQKLHNDEFKKISDTSFEEHILKKFGMAVKNKDIYKLDHLIDLQVKKFKNEKKNLEKFANENFFNFKFSSKISANIFNYK